MATRTLRKLQDLLDVDDAAIGDGKVPVWRTASGKHEYEAAGGAADLSSAVILAPAASSRNVIQPTAGAVIAAIVRAHAAQSVDLTQWQTSAAAVLAKIGPTGCWTIQPSSLGATGAVLIDAGTPPLADPNDPSRAAFNLKATPSAATDGETYGVRFGSYRDANFAHPNLGKYDWLFDSYETGGDTNPYLTMQARRAADAKALSAITLGSTALAGVSWPAADQAAVGFFSLGVEFGGTGKDGGLKLHDLDNLVVYDTFFATNPRFAFQRVAGVWKFGVFEAASAPVAQQAASSVGALWTALKAYGWLDSGSAAPDMATQAELDAHTGDTSDAHDASAISFSPTGTVAATDVQAAIAEVASEAGGISATLFDANTILKADSDDTPVALTMAASTILARLASGNIKAASVAEIITLLALAIDTVGAGTDITTNNASASKHGLLRKLDDSAQRFMDGKGNWSLPLLSNPLAPTGAIAETAARNGPAWYGPASLVSQRLTLCAVALPLGVTVTSISFVSSSTALSGGVHQLFGLFDDAAGTTSGTAYALLRGSADDTSAAWAANSIKTLALTSTYTTLRAGVFYIGILVDASTVPTLMAVNPVNAMNQIAPILCGAANTGVTALPNPATGLAATGNVFVYGYVS